MLSVYRRLGGEVPRFLALALLVAAPSGCEDPDRWGPAAARCAQVVHAYLESPAPVEIVGTPVQRSEGDVDVSFRTIDRVNIPVEGTASCNFAVGDGRLTLMEASVNGVALRGPDLKAIREKLDADG